MSKLVLLNSRVFANAVDLTGVSSKASMNGTYEEKDVTTFGSGGAKEVIAGLGSADVSVEGFWEAFDATKVDNDSWTNIGGAGPWSLCPVSANVSDIAYFLKAVETSYVLGGGVGDVAPFKASAKSTWPLVRGVVGNPPGTARTATGTGTAIQIVGGVPAGKSLYAALHVVSVAGTTPSATFRVESDTVGFPSPTTVLTFSAATAVGGQIIRVAGPITDDYFRVGWTISGTTPSFLALVAFGVA